MNESETAVSFSIDEIWAGEDYLNTTAQKCGQEVLAGIEPTIFHLVGGALSPLDI